MPEVIGETPDYPDPYSHTWQTFNPGWTIQKYEREIPQPDLSVWASLTTTTVYTSTADTNQVLLKQGVATLFALLVDNNNTNFDRYLRLYDTAAAPVAGVGTPLRTDLVPRGGAILIYSAGGEAYASGIGFTITGAAGDTDTTPINAGEVLVVATTDRIRLVGVDDESTGFGLMTGALVSDSGLGFGTIGT